MTAPDPRLTALAHRLARRDALAALLAASAGALALGAVPTLLLDLPPLAGLLLALVAGAGTGLVVHRRRPRATPEAVAAHLDLVYPDLQDSAALLLQPAAGLDLVGRLQRSRVAAAWAALPDPPLPRRGVPIAAATCAAAAALTAGAALAPSPAARTAAPPVLRAAVSNAAPAPPEVEALTVTVTPPAYAGGTTVRQDTLGVRALAGSRVSWRVRLDRPGEALLVFGRDTLRLDGTGAGPYEAARIPRTSSLYHLIVRADDAVYRSPDHRLVVAADRPPTLAVVHPEPRTLVPPGAAPRIAVEVLADDDVGLARADLVVTRARGSGESVTFDELVVPFASVDRASPRSWTLRATLALDTLGLEPGDGLYVHARAVDGRRPTPGEGRSETFFVVLEDTTQPALALEAAFGVNPLPAYFRSQRQIIIDTERLVAEQASMPADSFRARAAALGVDQKILRLRYGQFLGEEFESGLTPPPDVPPMGDDHDEAHADEAHADEAHADEAHADDVHVDHAPDAAPPDDGPSGFGTGADAMRAAYGHMHDSAEGATFYADHIEDALKAALAQMWEAELRLRTLRPADALPFEYAALRMIKDLQQQARIYVQRVGFEPPPLRPEERRLTGELDDAWSGTAEREATRPPSEPALRAALPVLGALADGVPPPPDAVPRLRAAGTAWAADALDGAGRSLGVLADLRTLVDALTAGAPACAPCAARAYAALWRALPAATPSADPAPGTRNALARRYFDALD